MDTRLAFLIKIVLAALPLFFLQGCLDFYCEIKTDMTSQFLEEHKTGRYVLLKDFGLVKGKGYQSENLLVPCKYIADSPPPDHEFTLVYSPGSVIKTVPAGTMIKIIKVTKCYGRMEEEFCHYVAVRLDSGEEGDLSASVYRTDGENLRLLPEYLYEQKTKP